MSYKVELFNKASLTKIKDIEVVNEPEIYEEINGSYTLDFDAHYSAKNDLTNDVLIKVDGQYFKIAKVTKKRDDSISLSVQCEHISYELIVDFEIDVDMEFESDAQTMLSECLQGTRFTLVSTMDTDVKYYKTNTLNIRKRLFEIANLFGGELIFDNFNVHLVFQRGTDKGLDITLGVNLIGVTEEKDYVEGTTAYELDLVDLSEVTGYELDFTRAEIGDTVTIIDNVLAINSNERIIAIRYNPFKRALPTVTVGDYIRDMTTYIKEEEEEEEEEETDIKDSFKQFKIGGIDMIKNASDASDDVMNYLTNKYVLGVEASSTYNTLKKELTGIVAEKADGVSGILSVIQTKVNENGLMVTTITEINSIAQLNSVVIKDIEHVTLVISDKQLSYYKANPTEAENTSIIAIGICVTFDSSDGVFLEKFNVGKLSLLGAENLDVTDSLLEFIEGNFEPNEYLLGAINEIDEQLKGLEVVPTDDYLDWYLTLVHAYNVGDGEYDWSMGSEDLPLENYANFKVTNHTKDFLVVVISNEPYEDILAGTASEDVYYKAFGGTFMMEEAPAEIGGASDYFDEFRVGDVDMLPLASDERTSTIEYLYDGSPIVAGAVHYELDYETLRGLFVTPKAEYADKYLVLYDYYLHQNGGYNMYDETYATNVQDYDIHGISVLARDAKAVSFTLALFEKSPYQLEGNETIEDVLIASFGIQVRKEGDEPLEPVKDQIFFEYGSCPLSDYMTLEFENGPYTEVTSVTTGIEYRPNQPLPATVSLTTSTPTPRDIASIPNITIIVSQERDWWDGTITGLTAESSYPYMEDVYVNFHAVCVKGYIPPQYVT